MKYVADLGAEFDTAAHRNTAGTTLENQLPADTTVWRYRVRLVLAAGQTPRNVGPAFFTQVEFDALADRTAWFEWIKANAQNAAGLVKLVGRRHDCTSDEGSVHACVVGEWKVWP